MTVMPRAIATRPADRPTRLAIARGVFVAASAAYAGAIFVQVFLAGLALMGAGLNVQVHREFAHIFLALGAVQWLALAFARLPRSIVLLTLGLAALMVLQGALILLRPVSPILPALHPVNALVVSFVALTVAKRSYRFVVGATRP
jgi:hypothetical protein